MLGGIVIGTLSLTAVEFQLCNNAGEMRSVRGLLLAEQTTSEWRGLMWRGRGPEEAAGISEVFRAGSTSLLHDRYIDARPPIRTSTCYQ
jgi:hypothetical protein